MRWMDTPVEVVHSKKGTPQATGLALSLQHIDGMLDDSWSGAVLLLDRDTVPSRFAVLLSMTAQGRPPFKGQVGAS
jgi:hypothetical protein